jgi:hypothetical protein
MFEPILIDNFFENPDIIRNEALLMEYVESSSKTGWKGFRVELKNDSVKEYILKKLIEIDEDFKHLKFDCFLHYSIESTKLKLKNNFEKNRLHKDLTDWAGVIYLHPNPPKNSGTTLHRDNGEMISRVDNVYNRFVFYRGDILHGVEDTFGDNIKNGRLTITIFGDILNNKNEKTLI